MVCFSINCNQLLKFLLRPEKIQKLRQISLHHSKGFIHKFLVLKSGSKIWVSVKLSFPETKHFLLRSISGEIFYLKPTESVFLVGKTGSLLKDTKDESISRNHCEIILRDGQVYLKDKSRYGTFLNEKIETNQKLPNNQEFLLNENCRIRFGRFDNIWSLSKFNYKIAISNVSIILLPLTICNLILIPNISSRFLKIIRIN